MDVPKCLSLVGSVFDILSTQTAEILVKSQASVKDIASLIRLNPTQWAFASKTMNKYIGMGETLVRRQMNARVIACS